MKLNPDCIRDLMLFFEEKTYVTIKNDGRANFAHFHALCPALVQELNPINKYSIEEVLYHVVQLSESGYIVTDFNFDAKKEDAYFRLSKIYYVTPKGHEFIASIKEEKRWSETLKVLKPIGGISLSIIESISSGITSAAIASITGQG